ncbi:hypothetical protein N9L75_07310 [Porticoccaceae bacterium]|nr:hypothetical protein [Porticoccaceae bacterium]
MGDKSKRSLSFKYSALATAAFCSAISMNWSSVIRYKGPENRNSPSFDTVKICPLVSCTYVKPGMSDSENPAMGRLLSTAVRRASKKSNHFSMSLAEMLKETNKIKTNIDLNIFSSKAKSPWQMG